MDAFFEHHQNSIRFRYRCFDRILLNALIQPFQQPERVVGFFASYRKLYPVSRDILRGIAERFQNWVRNRALKWGVPIVEAPRGRRDEFVDPYFRRAKPDQVVVILKAREPARIMIAIGNKQDNRWHLQIAQRWVQQYNFYVNDRRWGRMFVRLCPYLPFSARVYFNQHHWLANRLRQEGIQFQQCSNAFLNCNDPKRLQELADSLTSRDLLTCAHKWLAAFTPFFTDQERRQAGCQHRLFFAQVEYCDNLIFHRRAALDRLGERLLDANRTIGQPNKITTIFGRKVTKQYRGKLQTVIEDIQLPNPVIRSHFGKGFIKQYVRDHLNLRTEPATNNVADYGIKKAVEHLPALRAKLSSIIDSYLNVQQDILETFVDRGQLRLLAQPTVLPNGKRIPGLKVDHPRQLALMHALVRFANIAAGNTFTTQELYPHTLKALGCAPDDYSLASLRYDLYKLRAKGLAHKLPRSRRYQLTPQGYSLCLVFLKLFERVYAPLTAGLLHPVPGDRKLQQQRQTQLDRLYQRIADDLDQLLNAVGLKLAA
jgi:hypothetical protein